MTAPAEPVTPTSATGSLIGWAELCESAGATAKKLAKRELLAEYLRSLQTEDASRAAQYTAGAPFPETDPRRLNVGGALLAKAVAGRSGATPEALTRAYRRHGDIGATAQQLLVDATTDQPPLRLQDLEAALIAIAEARGPAAKLRILSAALARAGALEAKYVLKLLSGDMRIGVKQALVEEAIAAAYQRELSQVRHAVMLLGSLPETVIRAAADTLAEAGMRLFHPLGFMLASPVENVEEAVSRFREKTDETLSEQPLRNVQLEDKYDGMRAQLHVGDPAQPGRVGLFSRNREDLSLAFPELVEAFAPIPEPAILDGEILAWSPAPAPAEQDALRDGRALPFSALQQRLGRRQVSLALRRELPVIFMAFDLLYADERLLLDTALSARRARLARFLARHAVATALSDAEPQPNLFATEEVTQGFSRLILAPAVHLHSRLQLDRAYDEARARGNEGVMLKAADSVYQPGRRGLAWLKLKRSLATLDVVVTGAEFGSGRRAGYLSDYTFAVRSTSGDLLNVGKAYSGITDAEMHTLSAHFTAQTLEDRGHFRTVAPDTIFEVAFNNVMRSSRHASGFALRFPRILRIRTDKPLDEIDTLARVEEIYNSQPDRPPEQEPEPSSVL